MYEITVRVGPCSPEGEWLPLGGFNRYGTPEEAKQVIAEIKASGTAPGPHGTYSAREIKESS